MRDKPISNIYNPSEYLKEMADEETGRDELEPHQARVPEQLEFDFATPIDPVAALQGRVEVLEKRFDDLCSLISRVWGPR